MRVALQYMNDLYPVASFGNLIVNKYDIVIGVFSEFGVKIEKDGLVTQHFKYEDIERNFKIYNQ